MKNKQFLFGLACLVAGGLLYFLDISKILVPVGLPSGTVAEMKIYPAAAFLLLGAVQSWRSFKYQVR